MGVAFGAVLMILALYASILPRVRTRLLSAQEAHALHAPEGIAGEVQTAVGSALGELTATANL